MSFIHPSAGGKVLTDYNWLGKHTENLPGQVNSIIGDVRKDLAGVYGLAAPPPVVTAMQEIEEAAATLNLAIDRLVDAMRNNPPRSETTRG